MENYENEVFISHAWGSKKDPDSAESKDNVSASKGSSIGNIQIGGDVSGNIMIGNNNQVNNKK